MAHLKFSDVLKELSKEKVTNEELQYINEYGIGYIVSYTMHMIAQSHIWHLLCPSGQKHVALNELYTELETEVDGLAEKFIAQGGILSDVTESLIPYYSEELVRQKLNDYRELVSNSMTQDPTMASINDGLVDLQEVIDSVLYKFNLE